MRERWKNIPGFADYLVSNFGGIMSYKVKMEGIHIMGKIHKSGHRYVLLRRDGKSITLAVHRLVLEAFVGPCPEGMEACHRDGNPANNYVKNLRWDTRSENIEDQVAHGKHGNCKPVLCSDGRIFASASKAAVALGLHRTTISKSLNSGSGMAGGFKWSYYKEQA